MPRAEGALLDAAVAGLDTGTARGGGGAALGAATGAAATGSGLEVAGPGPYRLVPRLTLIFWGGLFFASSGLLEFFVSFFGSLNL